MLIGYRNSNSSEIKKYLKKVLLKKELLLLRYCFYSMHVTRKEIAIICTIKHNTESTKITHAIIVSKKVTLAAIAETRRFPLVEWIPMLHAWCLYISSKSEGVAWTLDLYKNSSTSYKGSGNTRPFANQDRRKKNVHLRFVKSNRI